MKFEEARSIHADAVAGLLATAVAVPEARWKLPRAEGKWSPAETLEHLAVTYDVLQRELDGRGPMKVVTKPWQRLLLRVTVVPRILRRGLFPSGARAPREVRPQMPATGQRAAIAAFRETSDRFIVSAIAARANRPGTRLTHAYFGRASLTYSLLLVARHIEHHTKQLG